jgi:hypothetical protein
MDSTDDSTVTYGGKSKKMEKLPGKINLLSLKELGTLNEDCTGQLLQ